jgi:trans-aconitate methyltransferase
MRDTELTPEYWNDHYSKYYSKSRAHLDIITGYCQQYHTTPSILDIGCGPGELYKKFHPDHYSHYTGIDSSTKAISLIEPGTKAYFKVADARTWRPTTKYDIIILCETLYFFKDPLAIFNKYKAHLKPNGTIITSIYQFSETKELYPTLKKAHSPKNSTTVKQNGKKFIISAF